MRALPMSSYETVGTDDEAHLRQILRIDELQSALTGMHKDVHERTTANRSRQREAHNRKTNLKKVNFTTGDFVLVRRAGPCGHKLKFTWVGPRRITECKSEWVFEVEDLRGKGKETVHARRLCLYRADMDGKKLDERLLKAATHSEAVYQDARNLCCIRERMGQLEILIEWDGLPDSEDRTWEPLHKVHEDIPEMLNDFLAGPGQKKLKKEALSQVSTQ